MAIGLILPVPVIQPGFVWNQQKPQWWQNFSQAICKKEKA
jgi:hypothetical protein